jgi:hypothetical protein
MYDKIAKAMNADERFDSNFNSSDIELFLRDRDTTFVTYEEGVAIEDYLDQFL